jgi:hypothetical protein
VTVDGVTGTRRTSGASPTFTSPFGPPYPTDDVLYDFFDGIRTYLIDYVHYPEQSAYVRDQFDLLIQTFRFSA